MGKGQHRDLAQETGIVGNTKEVDAFNDKTLDFVRKLIADEKRSGREPIRKRETDRRSATRGPGISQRLFVTLKRCAPRFSPLRRFSNRPSPIAEETAKRDISVTPRMIVPAIFAAVFLIEPWLIPGLGIFALTLVTIVYFSLGPDRVTELVAFRYERLSQRDPEKAMRLRQGAAKFTARAAAWIERLPKRWTTGLYLPDFDEQPELHEKLSTDPFDRLASDARNI